ncbi:MAG: ribosome maturation factor RimM [Acidimicrobiales bacterium]|nr:ribosome maturation factor RimM [Acidimicrobiales bacterium]
MTTRLEVGRITKPHGVRGDVLVLLTTERTSRLDPGSVLFTDRGPLRVVSSSKHQDRWIVHFDEISGRDEAEAWRGVVLEATSIDDPGDEDVLWVHELIGSTVQLVDGTEVGTVIEVQGNPASDLLVLDDGALVPVVFVTDRAEGRVTIDPPDGLFDL